MTQWPVTAKIVVSAISVVFVALLWMAKPAETLGQKALLFTIIRGRGASLFRPTLTAAIVIVNIAIWV